MYIYTSKNKYNMNAQLPIYFLGGSIGVALQILFKIQSLKSRSKLANHSFSLKEYFNDDWVTILTSFVCIGAAVYVIDEFIKKTPELVDYIKWFFIFVGYSGSSVIQSVLSVTSKKINSIIDIKSNIADGIKPAVNPTNIEGVQEIKKDEEKTN